MDLKSGKPVPGWCFQYVDQKYSMSVKAQLNLIGELFDQVKIPIKDPTLKDIKFLKEQLNEGPLINSDCEKCGIVWYHCKCEEEMIDDTLEKTGVQQDRIPDELIEEIINKYGPEGCYEMAEKLIAAANKDISNALSE